MLINIFYNNLQLYKLKFNYSIFSLFNIMNYQKHYNFLVEKAKTRQLPKDLYIERHHIKPCCMNDSNDNDNIVALTAEEHYVAHQLLVKIYPKNHKLLYAANMMSLTRASNKTYGWLKRKMSTMLKNRKLSKEHKQKLRIAATNPSKQIRKNMSQGQIGTFY